jgi:hypothetical protein
MIKYLTFISLAVILCSCTPKMTPASGIMNPMVPEITARPMHFKAAISFGTNSVTGIMAVKQRSDLAILGSFTNEFGVKAFDFIYQDGKTDLVYLMPALNRKMIKKILRRDISLLSGYGIGSIGRLSNSKSGKSPVVLYPDPAIKYKAVKDIFISGNSIDQKIIIALEDFRYKLRIDLVSLPPDEE